MPKHRRPRVAAIGLDGTQIASIAPLCGELRLADSVSDYLTGYSWSETDVVVSRVHARRTFACSVNLVTLGSGTFSWSDTYGGRNASYPNRTPRQHNARTGTPNTERELSVSTDCHWEYRPLADDLCRHLSRAEHPPDVMKTSRRSRIALVETTSGHSVALRLVLPSRSTDADGDSARPIALLLPEVPNLAAWFRAFLCDVHKSDRERVPQAPPRLVQPSDWYTPREQNMADRITQIRSDIQRLSDERDQLQSKLADESEKEDLGIRRILWADGDDLVAATEKVLSDLGFKVRNMDGGVSQGEPKREDLRLTLQDRPGWQAIVEVKGYAKGTKTNDALQIRQHRERYIAAERQSPDLTLWLANPFRRTEDPSLRPKPDENVKKAAALVGAVYVLASELYRQWALVAANRLEAETVVQSLINSGPGLWVPANEDSET